MRLDDMSVKELKAELVKLGLAVNGLKAELVERLRAALVERGNSPGDVESIRFRPEAAGGDVGMQLRSGAREAAGTADAAVEEEETLVATAGDDMIGQMAARISQLAEIVASSERAMQQLYQQQQMHGQRVDSLDEGMRQANSAVGAALTGLEHIRSRGGNAEGREAVKLPTYDGSTSWAVYRIQFDAAMRCNRWSEERAATFLALALRGSAAGVLHAETAGGGALMLEGILAALDLRFGDAHLQQVHGLALRGRKQEAGEGLQELFADIDRLARLAYPGADAVMLGTMIVDSFANAIIDRDVQLAVRTCGKATPSAILAHALTYEAAKVAAGAVSGGGAHRVRGIVSDASSDGPGSGPMEQERGNRRDSRLRCWRCGEPGHLRWQCRRDAVGDGAVEGGWRSGNEDQSATRADC